MNFLCPHCKLKLKCEDEFSGQVVRCPNCEGKIKVPEAPAGRGASPPTNQGEQPGGEPDAGAGGAPAASWQPTDSSNVSMSVTFGIGLLFMIVFYAITFPLQGSYFGDLFWDRGWVPFVLVLLLGWSGAILLLKLRKLRQQKRAMLLDVLPDSISREITVDNVADFLAHVAQLPSGLQQSLIVRRMQLGLRHFQVRHSNPEVANMMMSQSEIDASTIASSYSLLKVFLWAIPILGFVGTVIGISEAIGGFSGALESAQDISALKGSLNSVTMGLAVAFDTTLVALVMSLVISFPLNAMQKAEEDLLGWVDAYCNENLLKRLNDSAGLPSGAEIGDAGSVVQAICQTFTRSEESILSRFREVQEHMSNVQEDQAAVLQRMAETIDEQLASMEERAKTCQEQLQNQLCEIVTHIGAAMKEIGEGGKAVGERADRAITESMEAVKGHMSALTEGLEGLNRVLTDLGEKQVVIQQVESGGWRLPFFSKK